MKPEVAELNCIIALQRSGGQIQIRYQSGNEVAYTQAVSFLSRGSIKTRALC